MDNPHPCARGGLSAQLGDKAPPFPGSVHSKELAVTWSEVRMNEGFRRATPLVRNKWHYNSRGTNYTSRAKIDFATRELIENATPKVRLWRNGGAGKSSRQRSAPAVIGAYL
jgi:hypothetical protein